MSINQYQLLENCEKDDRIGQVPLKEHSLRPSSVIVLWPHVTSRRHHLLQLYYDALS